MLGRLPGDVLRTRRCLPQSNYRRFAGRAVAFDLMRGGDAAAAPAERDQGPAALTVQRTGLTMPIRNNRCGGNCPKIAILKRSFTASMNGPTTAAGRYCRRTVGNSLPTADGQQPTLSHLLHHCQPLGYRRVAMEQEHVEPVGAGIVLVQPGQLAEGGQISVLLPGPLQRVAIGLPFEPPAHGVL